MSLIDDFKTPKPWDLGTPANGVTMYNETVKPLDDNIRLVASAVDNLPQPSEQVQADWNTSATSAASYIKNKPWVPEIDYTTRKVLMVGTDARPDWQFPLVVPKLACSNAMSPLSSETFSFTVAGMDVSASPEHNFADMFDPYALVCSVFEIEKIKAKNNSTSSKLRLHPFPDESSFSFYDNYVPCPVPMNSDWSQISYSGHEDGAGNYQVEKMLVPFTYYNDTSASKGLAVTFGSPGESDLSFEPQNITIKCLSFTKTHVDNKDLYHRNNWNWGYNDFDPVTGKPSDG